MSIVDRYRWGARVLLAALICAVLAGSGFDSTVSAQSVIDYDADDDGLIEVTTEAQLNAIRWDMDGNGVVDASANATSYSAAFPTAAPQMGCPSAACAGYELAADISLTSSSGMGWEPIGNSATRFNATFEGNAHTISNLFINRTFVNTTADNMGLFGATGSASAIRNVKLTSVDVTGNDNVGALAGDNKGQIENCEATGTVTGRLDVGGLVGENYGPITGSSASGTVTSFYLVGGLVGLTYGSISTSRASADVTATRTDGSSFAGGLVGWNVNSLISNSHASGNVTGSDTIGGLVGSNKGPISGSTASGAVTATGNAAGGLVGWNSGPISVSTALNPSVTGANAVGGLVGQTQSGGTIRHSIATANVIGTQRVGGLVGLSLGPISHSYASGDVHGTGKVGGLVGDNTGSISGSTASGTVTTTGNEVGGLVGWNNGPISDSDALNPSVTGVSYVGGLVGQNDGAGGAAGSNAISGSTASGTVTATGSFAGGLVGSNEGPISDSDALNPSVTGVNWVGGLVGFNANAWSISGSTARGPVTASGSPAGGLVGQNTGPISGSSATGTVTGRTWVGGLVGLNNGPISGSSASGEVTATRTDGASRAGGLVGENRSTPISNSHASGDVTGSHDMVGGLVGHNLDELASTSSTPPRNAISGSTASGTVTTTGSEVGGLVGWNNGPISDSDALNPSVTGVSYVGGLVGQNDGAGGAAGSNAISGSTASGTVTATGSFAGGLVGSNEGPISDSDALNPSVTGLNWVGGLVGFNANAWPISGSTARGPVTASGSPAGGLVGQNTGPISGSSATGTVTGRTWVGGLVGLNNGPISGSSASGEVTATRTDGASRAGGLVGENRSTPISNSHASGDVTGSHDMVGGLVGHNLDELASTSSTPPRNAISGSTASGAVTTTGSEDDGRLSGKQIGGLVGWNNGPISDSAALNPSVTGARNVGGLVGSNTAPISGSTARGAVTATGGQVGGLVGQNHGPISDSAALNPSVTGENSVGGLVGWNTAPISGSTARGAVTATGRAAGGLVGDNTAGIAGSVATGSVTGPWAGGLVGYSVVGSISRSAATGAVSGGILVGGLVAYISAGSITESWASGAVSVTSQGQVGGLVGSSEVSTVSASFATGNVTASFATGYAGGLIGGNSGAVHASYATGNVTVSDDTSCVGASCPRGAGGLIGFAGDTSRVTSGSRVSNVQASYSTGMVSKMSGSSTYSLGGLAGIGERDADVPANNAVFTNSYWDNETSGQTLGVGSDDEDANGTIDGTETATAGVTGQTTSALKAPTGYTGIFADWNVTIPLVTARTGGPWDFGAATDYPVLRGLGAPPAFPAGTATISVAEEGAAYIPIGSPLTATATVGDQLFYKLVGAGAVFFSIHPATGQLSTTTRLDYENPADANRDNTYELMVQASDGMTVAFRTVAVSVTNVDDAGAVALTPNRPTDRPTVGKALTATLSDPDGGVTSPTWTWAWSTFRTGTFTPISGASSATYTPVSEDEGRYLKASVTYTDSLGSGKTAEITSVFEVVANPPPRFFPSSVTLAVDENATTGTVGTVAATDPDNDAITYSVGGADEVAFNEDFSLGSTSGMITVNSDATIDYESKGFYRLEITATDPFGGTAPVPAAVTINVTNLDEAGTVALTVEEPVMGRPLTATLSDPDTLRFQRLPWTWAWSTLSTGPFTTISGASSATYTPVLGDVGRYLKATVRYTDGQGSGKSAEMTSASAVAANPPPEFSDASPTFAVDEGATTGTTVGTVTATDPDGEVVTYSLGGADITAFREDFSYDSTSGAITVKTGATIDHERRSSYAVTITATDTAGITAMAAVTINVPNLDEAGAVDLPPGRPVVGKSLTATLSDPDGGVTIPTWTWAWSTSSSGSFTPISSASSATYTPVPEDEGRYLKASVSYTDGQGSGKTAEMTSANAVSANPAPVFDPTSVTFAVDENATTGTAVGTVTATDIDNNRIIYSVGGAGAVAFNQDFSLDSASGAITVGAPIDHENKASYAVTITATDPFESAGTISVTINVTNVDEAGTVTLPVDDPVMGRPVTATLSDPDGEVTSQIWTWAWSTSSTGGFSTISGASSATYTPVLGDVGRWLKARVSYSDFQGSGKTAEMTSADAVAANPPPAFANSSPTFAVNENATSGAVGTVTATDPDGEAVTYSVSVGGADVTAFNEDFSLGSSSGAITVKTGATIDHESKASYAVTITATDIVGITATAGVTINVTDVDEAGVVALTADTPAVGKPLTAILSDPDGGVTSPTWTWASSTTRTGSFTTISSASSATYTPVQGDVARFLKASVSYTDSFGVGKTAEMASVNAVSANPPPVFANSSPTFTVDENASSGAVGTVTAADPESEAVTYSVGGADVTAFNEDFSLGSTSGAITVKSGATIDHERKSSYAVTITATDTASVTATAAVTINVTDVDEAGTVDLMPDTLEVGKQLTATLSDPDGGVTSPTWTWASSTTRTGNFRTLNGANSASYTVGPGDVARFLKASVSYTDSFGSGKTAEMTSANAAAASPPPVFGDASVTFTVDENATTGPVGTVTATDPDTDAITYSVDGAGAPAFNDDFSLGSASGTIRVKPDATIDHESRPSYSVTITATDRFGSTDTISVTINVTDVDEAGTVALTADTPAVGSSLTATLSDLDGGVTGETWTWAWSTDRIGTFTPIPGASSATYTPVQGDFARFLKASVSYTDSFGSGKTAEMASANAVAANPSPIISGGGGGGGGGGGPSPSVIDFEWSVTRDIDDLGSGHDKPSGQWSDGTTLWILENGDGADDAIYAYDLKTGERVPDREFALDGANRAPRGVWSDGATVWVSDSGRNRLYAHSLETGERLPERDIAFAGRNRDARGIWSGDETMWVLDGGKNSLFAYDLASGALLAEYVLDDANGDPHGIWSDRVTVWVSDHGAKRLFAYRLPARPEAPAAEDAERQDLERVSDEEFKDLSKASNNSPRGIWSDGDVMYVADESDAKVYTYNMPGALDARLASLTLSGVDIGEFGRNLDEYEGAADEGVTETTVTAEAVQRRADVVIDPPDADEAAEGHQVALEDLGEITVTVTSADGSRKKTYRVRLAQEEVAEPVASCLRGDIAVGFSLAVSAGGSIEDLVACAEDRNVTALYTLDSGAFVSYILGAPELVNRSFAGLFAAGVPALTPLIARSDGPATADPDPDAVTGPLAACLQGEIAEGFNLVVYEGGSVGELEACAEEVGLAALYALNDGVWVSYIVGAPEFVNAAFRELFLDGVPVATPLVGKRD